ncbi:MAG TPA: IclR family transcriptional regulator C-terminal domain-containing protein [Rectinemataceae bacterium]|nr:IclR family transcriptional regulator C-terminal domain-containing protein [Rectinemataceae bacterium]
MPKKRRAPAPVALVSAVVRVFTVLERMSRERSVGLEELSREVGLAKPTVYRFLQTLQELGYIRRDESDKWAMTLKLFNVGSRALDHLDLYSAARPMAEALSEDLGETVHMGVLEGDSAVYVLKIESKYTIRMFSRVGRRIPLYCTAIGKVLLAYMCDDERERLLADTKLVAFTPKTLTERSALDAELERIRAEGLAHDDEEHEEGIRCIGSPIFDYTGSVVAAMSASWPRFRWDRGDEAQMAAKVKGAAARVSEILGRPAD